VNGQIVAMGGATSPAEDHDPRIDVLILSLTGRPRPRVCYLGTAGGDHEHGTYAFYRAMSRHDCRPTELTFFERVVENLEAFVNDQDVFWVAGGSTANLLAVWRLHGLDSLLQTADERGAVLGDVSAGMNYWFEGTTTDSFGPALRALPDGLGFSLARPVRTTTRTRAPAALAGLWTRERCLPDGSRRLCGAAFRDGELVESVNWRDEARSYRVEPGTEIPLPTRIL
jgi:dipeptidase E